MLKEGHKHLSGLDEAVIKNIDACKQLSKITRTSLGPNGACAAQRMLTGCGTRRSLARVRAARRVFDAPRRAQRAAASAGGVLRRRCCPQPPTLKAVCASARWRRPGGVPSRHTAPPRRSTLTSAAVARAGMNKMVINHLEKLFVTSDAATIVKELEVAHPAAKLVVLAAQAQEAEIGDGTNLARSGGRTLQSRATAVR